MITLVMPKYYTKALFKFGFALLMLVCGILNFELLDLGFTQVGTDAMSIVAANG